MKLRRKKLTREDLENQLAKCERRIQKIAENAYDIRRLIAALDASGAPKITVQSIASMNQPTFSGESQE